MKKNINIQINLRRRITFRCRVIGLNVTREDTKTLVMYEVFFYIISLKGEEGEQNANRRGRQSPLKQDA